jgi:leucyl aminopeptidase (aminopeptidase T)
MSLERLMKGARIAVNECMEIKPDEKVVIITDKNMPKNLSEALMQAIKEVGAKCEIKLIELLKVNGQEPPEDVAELMKNCDVLFLVTSKSLSHTKARRNASKSGVRIASMPKVTEFSFVEGGLTANYKEVKELIEKIHDYLKNAKTIRITSDNGTDLKTNIEGRKWDKDDGLIHEKGKFCNLPAGEIAVAPIEGTAQGVVVIDKMGKYGEKIRYTVKNGFVEKIEGSELLEKTVEEIGHDARNIAEIGIGTNPKARIIGNILEDEKVFGTVHMAIGSNLSFGGSVDVPLHLDGIILKPTLEVDGKILIKDGKWVFLDDSTDKFLRKNKPKVENNNFSNSEKSKTEFQVTQSKPSYRVSYDEKSKPYEPYIVREPLESHYFDPWIGGWTRLNNRFVINPTLYGYWIKIVEIHEKIHNIYKTGNEGFVERMTRYNFRNGYFNLGNY